MQCYSTTRLVDLAVWRVLRWRVIQGIGMMREILLLYTESMLDNHPVPAVVLD